MSPAKMTTTPRVWEPLLISFLWNARDGGTPLTANSLVVSYEDPASRSAFRDLNRGKRDHRRAGASVTSSLLGERRDGHLRHKDDHHHASGNRSTHLRRGPR